jgi:hypothetical protein
MAKYYSVKCSYGASEQYYHRNQGASHSHTAQDRFVTDAKSKMARAQKTTSDNVGTTNIQSNLSTPKTNSILI